MGKRRRRSNVIIAHLLFATSAFYATVAIGSERSTSHYSIDAGLAVDRLPELAREANVSVLFDYELIASVNVSPVHGEYTFEEALNRMLEGTPLTGDVTKTGIVKISISNKAGDETMTNRQPIRTTLLGTVFSVVFGGANGAAIAQQGPEQVDDGQRDVVIVTARKREEALQDDWRALFWVGIVSIPFVFVINRFIREPQRFSEASASEPKARLSDLFAPSMRGRTLILFIAQYLFVWAYAGSIFLFPSFLAEDRGLSKEAYSLFIGIGNLVGVLGYIAAAFVGEFILTRRDTVVIWTLAGAAVFQFLIWGTETYIASLFAFCVMAMFFYGTAAVKFAYVAELFPTRLRATGVAFCGSLAVTLGSASGPLMTSLVTEAYGWSIGLSVVVGCPLAIAGLLYFLLARVPSGLEVEEVEEFLQKGRKAS